METFEQYGINIPYRKTSGKVKMACPQCQKRGERTHPNDKSLSVDLDKRVWHCHYCGWKGCLGNKTKWQPIKQHKPMIQPKKEYKKPSPWESKQLSPKMVEYFKGRCISEKTLADMKIGEGEYYFPQKGERMYAIHYNYFLDGERVNIKYRAIEEKVFALFPEAELVPYNIDSVKGVDECIITEGEADTLSFIEIGCKNCVSVPNGAKSTAWLDNFFESHFEDKKRIYIAGDTDETGQGLISELVNRLGGDRCRIVTYGEGCKDANDHLVKFGRDSLRQCLENAEEPAMPPGIITLDDYELELDELYLRGPKKGFKIGFKNFDSLCTFETKRLCVVTGIPSHGKSEFVDEMVCRLNLLHGFKAAFFTPENFPTEYHARKLIEKLCGNQLDGSRGGMVIKRDEYDEAKSYLRDNFFHIYPEDVCTLDNVLNKARQLVRRRGVKVLVIDPYNRIESEQDKSETETQYISKDLDKITGFAQRNDVLVILVAHPRKMPRDKGSQYDVPKAYDICGSSNFFNKADYVMTVYRDFSKEHTLVRIEKVKFRHLGGAGDATFKYNSINGRYEPYDENNNPPKVFDDSNRLRIPLGSAAPPDNGSEATEPKPLEKRNENELPF